MFVRSFARASTLCCALVGAVLLGLTIPAHATPPSITAPQVTIPLPQIGQTNVVNLRLQGVVAGSAPIVASTGQGIVFIGGQPSSTLGVSPIGSGASPGAICLELMNNDFTPTAAPIEFDLFLQNADGTINQRIALVLGSAATVDLQDPQQAAACADPNQPPTADAGADRTIVDTDGAAGENVALTGTGIDPEGEALTFAWFSGNRVPLATGQNPTVGLPAGVTTITLQVTDASGAVGTDTVVITVNAPVVPTANAGPDQSLSDTDGQAGEVVTLNGTGSTDTDGTIVSYEWIRVIGADAFEALGTGATLTVRLPDGSNDVRLNVVDNAGNRTQDSVVITIAAVPPETVLSEIPGLTPNQSRMANKLDSMCNTLAQLSNSQTPLSRDQTDLLTKCNGLRINNTTANQVEAIEEMIPDDFSAARTQTLLFANTQYASIMDRPSHCAAARAGSASPA
jgi:hypothetical protein